MELTATNRSRAWPKGQGRKWYNSSHVVPELENFMLAWEFDSSAKRRERTIMNKTELRSNESTKCGFVNVRLWTEVLRMKSLCAVLKVQWNIKVEIPFKGEFRLFLIFCVFLKKVLDGAIHLCYTTLAFGRRRSFFLCAKDRKVC